MAISDDVVSTKSAVTVVDYGMGNLYSVQRAIEYCGGVSCLASLPEDIGRAQHLLLPGVGAFADGMKELQARDLADAVKKHAEQGKPLLGICLGMQILLEESEEFGLHQGLAIIPGRVVPIPPKTDEDRLLRIPHVGWNELVPPRSAKSAAWENTILDGTRPGASVYFVHSYVADCRDTPYDVADCRYGGWTLPAVIRRDNTHGCQFHPEKSGPVGLRILKRFMEMEA